MTKRDKSKIQDVFYCLEINIGHYDLLFEKYKDSGLQAIEFCQKDWRDILVNAKNDLEKLIK